MPPTAPTPAPPNFYENMSGAGAPPPPGGAQGGAKGGKDQVTDSEILSAFKGIFRVMEKMAKAKPELSEKIEPARQQLKKIAVDMFGVDPTQTAEGGAPAPEAVAGNMSPQGVPPAPPEPRAAEAVPA
jgi:hypothetical protein